MKISIKRFDKDLPLPVRDPGAAGLDFSCRESVTIPPHTIGLVPLNCAVKVPENHFLLLAVRSSTPRRKGLMLANGIGVIDPFYNGDKDEIWAELFNFTDRPVEAERGECLVQGIFIAHLPVEWAEVASHSSSATEAIST